MIARSRRRFALAALAATIAVVAAAPVGAQQAASMPAAGAGTAQYQGAAAGPTLERAAVGARPLAQQPASLDEAEAAMQARLGLGKARALMIVGFSAVIVGLLIGEEPGAVIAIAGAAVGLYGLYHYLK